MDEPLFSVVLKGGWGFPASLHLWLDNLLQEVERINRADQNFPPRMVLEKIPFPFMLSDDLLLLSLIRYSILDKDCPIAIDQITGQLSTLKKLDRELEATHVFQVKAQEEPNGASQNHLLMLFLLNNRASDKILEPCVIREGISGRTVFCVQLFWIYWGMGALRICINLTYCHITWRIHAGSRKNHISGSTFIHLQLPKQTLYL